MRDVIVQRCKDLESQREQAETPSSRKLVVVVRMQHTQNPPSVSFSLPSSLLRQGLPIVTQSCLLFLCNPGGPQAHDRVLHLPGAAVTDPYHHIKSGGQIFKGLQKGRVLLSQLFAAINNLVSSRQPSLDLAVVSPASFKTKQGLHYYS